MGVTKNLMRDEWNDFRGLLGLVVHELNRTIPGVNQVDVHKALIKALRELVPTAKKEARKRLTVEARRRLLSQKTRSNT